MDIYVKNKRFLIKKKEKYRAREIVCIPHYFYTKNLIP